MKSLRSFFTNHAVALLSLILLAAALRTQHLTTPLADWHSWRQADTASVTREYVKHNYSFFVPHYHDLSNIPSGLDNTDGYRMVEFPIVNALIAGLLRLQPSWDLVATSRVVSILFSLVGMVSLYGFVWLLTGRKSLSFGSALVYAVLPYSIYYSRVILPEPAMLGTQLAGLFFFTLWLQNLENKKAHTTTWIFYVMAAILTSLSILLKPTAIFIAPVYAVLTIHYLKLKTFTDVRMWLFGVIVVAPTYFWREWITQFPSGIPASAWLLNSNGIRLRPAWWRWLFDDRLSHLMLGGYGLIPLITGLLSKSSLYLFPRCD